MPEFSYNLYDIHSIRSMFRVARLVTPNGDQERWIATMDNRTWRMDNGRWHGTGGWDVARYLEGDMREHLTEQLFEYGVTPDSALWESF